MRNLKITKVILLIQNIITITDLREELSIEIKHHPQSFSRDK